MTQGGQEMMEGGERRGTVDLKIGALLRGAILLVTSSGSMRIDFTLHLAKQYEAVMDLAEYSAAETGEQTKPNLVHYVTASSA
jgi:hypothetical protein